MNFFRLYAAVTEAETAKAKAAAALLQGNDENKIPEVEKPKAKKTKAAKQTPAPEPAVQEEEMTDLPDESGEDGEE